jgi:hypothetical protein
MTYSRICTRFVCASGRPKYESGDAANIFLIVPGSVQTG